ncbi:MAG: hypothetical protein AB4290_18550, partial [Spirulina sp.]
VLGAELFPPFKSAVSRVNRRFESEERRIEFANSAIGYAEETSASLDRNSASLALMSNQPVEETVRLSAHDEASECLALMSNRSVEAETSRQFC